ncbi:TlyA family RNA methyltransferase [Calidifontibacter terrae]
MAAEGSARLDQRLVELGLARSRAVAAELIALSRVTVDGSTAAKPSVRVTAHARVEVIGEVDPWVGRAAYKLLGALAEFAAIDPAGKRAIDLGASTGGFTQVLRSRGAVQVEAVDVGHDQLAPVVRDDPAVRDWSGYNLRDLDPTTIGGPAALVVADLSFISLRLVLRRMAALLAPGGDLVVLVKPQFEVGRERLGHGGVVRSSRERARAVREVLAEVIAVGLTVHGLAPSTVAGSNGNQEYLLWARHESVGKMDPARIEAFVAAIERDKADGTAHDAESQTEQNIEQEDP